MSSREIKKTEAGREYQTDVLSKEYKRLKKNVGKQLNLFDQLVSCGDEGNVRLEVEKLNKLLAELSCVSQRLEQLVPEEEANRIKKETELESENAAKVVLAMNEWLEARRMYPFHDSQESQMARKIHDRERNFDKISSKSMPREQNWDQRSYVSLPNFQMMSSLNKQVAKGKHTLSERSFRAKEDRTAKDESKSRLRKFKEELLEEMSEIGKRILLEINMIRIAITDFASEGLQDRLNSIESLKERRENPAIILFRIMNDVEASRLAEKMAMEDSQIEEIRSIIKEVENLQHANTQAEELVPQEFRPSRQDELNEECIAMMKQGVNEVKSVVKRMRRQQSDLCERQSNRSCRSRTSLQSAASSFSSRTSVGWWNEKNQVDNGNKVNTLKMEFEQTQRELKDLKSSCLNVSKPTLANGKLLEMDNVFNKMKETGRRLREHLSSTEAEEVTIRVQEEDEEVFEVKQKVVEKMTQKRNKILDETRQGSSCENKKDTPERKEGNTRNDDKRSLEYEVTTLKVKLDNQKKLVSNILSTYDREMIKREMQTLDRRYDEYVAAQEQVRCVSPTEEVERISKQIAEEDNEVFQLKSLATKSMSLPGSKKDESTSKVGDEDDIVEQSSEKAKVTAEEEENSPSLLKLNELMIQTIKLQSAPKVEIETFKGDPLEYDYFMENFKDVVENLVENPKQRLVRLLKYTEGDAKELIKHCVHEDADSCYEEALRLLEKEYGNPLRLSCAYLERLKNWPPIKTNEIGALKCLYRFLLRCVAFKKKGNIDLDSPLTIRCVQLALPVNMQDGWTAKAGKIRKKNQVEAVFQDMVEFIDEWCQRLSDPVYARVKNKEIKILKTELKEKCPACTLQHDMDDCPTFSSKTVREKRTSYSRQRCVSAAMEGITQLASAKIRGRVKHAARNIRPRYMVLVLKH